MNMSRTRDKTLGRRRRLVKNFRLKARQALSKNRASKGSREIQPLKQLKKDINQVQAENVQLKVEINRLKSGINQAEAEKIHLESHYLEERQTLQLELEKLKPKNKYMALKKKKAKNISPTLQLELDWISGPDMPVDIYGYIQSVDIDGTVYVGGGENDCIVRVYNTRFGKWHSLPPYSTKRFGMTTFKNKLILVGGMKGNSAINELGEWQSYSKTWTHPYPPMFFPRAEPSVTSYRHWLVVAGGYAPHCGKIKENMIRDSIEILNTDLNQWSRGRYTPVPWHGMKSKTIGNTWYLMGGHTDKNLDILVVYSVSLEDLISYTPSVEDDIEDFNFDMWTMLPPLESPLCSPLILQKSLFAVGLWDNFNCCDTDSYPPCTIKRYIPESSTWLQVGELPCEVPECTTIMILNKIILIFENKVFTSLVK